MDVHPSFIDSMLLFLLLLLLLFLASPRRSWTPSGLHGGAKPDFDRMGGMIID